jgi:hypothetical protein
LGHIQSRCEILETPRIAAHHMIWREILLQLFGLSGDEGDEQKWVIPSAVSADSHKELTVRQIFQHFDLFASDTVLENKISAFFALRATLALSHRLLSEQELQALVSTFLDLRPDGFAIHQKSKRVVILEFRRAMDSLDDWEVKKDAEKRA